MRSLLRHLRIPAAPEFGPWLRYLGLGVFLLLVSHCGGGGGNGNGSGGTTVPSVQNYTVTFVAGAGGSLTGTTFQTVASGASCTAVTAVPNSGYTFTNWTGAGFTTSSASPLTVTNVSQNLTITANFTPQSFTVTFVAGAGGSLTGSTTQTVAYGSSAAPVSAVPNTGYTFTDWTGAGFTSTNANPLTVTNVTQNLTITANFAQQTFTVTFVAGAGGSVTGNTSQTVAYGTSATAVSAVPNTGYTFTNWTGAGFTSTNASPLTVTNVTQNLTITANFTQQTFTVTFVAGAGGSISGSTTQTVAYGTSAAAVSAVPNTGYTFTNWTGAGFTSTNASPLTVSNVTQNLTITANFTQQTFTVTFMAGAGGSITGSTSQTVLYGTSATAVSAVPNTGYTFTNWTGAGFTSTNASPLTVTNVTQNLTITANFTQQTFSVTFVAGAGGSITGTSTQTVAYGASAAPVSAVPNTGYTFTNWTGPGFTSTNASPLTVTNVTQNLTITANFTPQSFTVTFVAGAGGSLTGSTTQTVAYGTSATAVSAVPNTGYTFTNWTGAGFTTTNASPLTVSNVTQNLAITANFTQQTFSVTFVAGAGGSLAGNTSQTVAYGTSATGVSAVPNTGYTFTNWTGAGFTSTNASPLTVTNVTQNLTITANFAQQTFTVTFVAGTGGSLAGSTSQTVAYGTSATAVSAVPNTGYTFTNWTGAGFTSTNASPLTVSNVTQNLTITANFTQQTFTVTFVGGSGGSLTGNPSQTVPYGGSASLVIAVPSGSYAFLNWTGTGGFAANATNPLTVANVTADMAITANFTLLNVVKFLAGANGSMTGTATQAVATGSDCTQVNAVPNAGWAFTSWTGTGGFVTSVSNPLTVTNVSAGMTITANFGRLPAIGSFTATATTINAGQSAILNWGSVNFYTSASIDNGGGAIVSPNGLVGLYPAATTTYTLTASNAVGTVTSSVTVTVITKPVISSFTATPASITVGGSSTLAWTVAGSGVTYSLDQGIGAVGGTSLDVTPAVTKTYTLTATNAAGSKTATATVTVSAAPPTGLGYANSPATYTKGVAIVANAPSNSGGAIASYTVAPALPAGLNLDPSSGSISGTPTALAPSAVYRITGTNSGGSTFVDLSLAVLDALPVIGYGSWGFTFHVGTPLTPLVPTQTGGTILTWAIAPALPAGLSFNTGTGTISGTPSAAAANQTYTITATNSGGSGVATPSLQVLPPAPVITLQPHGLILAAGTPVSFSTAATGTGTLSFQWSRNGTPIPGATATSYDLGNLAAGDDGAVFTVAVTDTFGSTTSSDTATLALLQDLATWLNAHPAIAGAIKWQYQAASGAMGVYQAPAETDKKTWANWSALQQADLNQAYLDVIAWINQGAPQVTMPVGALGQTTPTDTPWNIHPSANDPNASTLEMVQRPYFWKLYLAHVAFSLMLETSHQVPWSVTDYPDSTLKWLFDSATMGWYLANWDGFYMGTYDQANFPPLRTNNRPRTSFADPRWTYPWLKQAGIIGATRLATIGTTLDWMRHNLTHFYDAESLGRDLDIWQYNGYSPLSRIATGTIDAKYPGVGTQHWTAGCHGSTGFLHAALRVLNIPVQPVWVCGHELVYFMSEDKYMDHADDPYNGVVRASNASSLLLLIDSATWRTRFGNDETVNFLNLSDPVQTWIGYTAAHFP